MHWCGGGVMTESSSAVCGSQISIARIVLTLSYLFVIGFVMLGVPAVVLPVELSLFTADAAAVSSALTACYSTAVMVQPLVGVTIDRSRSHRPYKLITGVSSTLGVALLTVAVHVRGAYGLPGVVIGMLLIVMPSGPKSTTRPLGKGPRPPAALPPTLRRIPELEPPRPSPPPSPSQSTQNHPPSPPSSRA